ISGLYDESVKFVVVLCKLAALPRAHARNRMPWLRAQSRHSQYFRPCASDGLFDEYANFIVLRLGADDSVPFKDSSRVGIHHKYRMVAGIKQNGIGSFRPNSVQRQQLGAKL